MYKLVLIRHGESQWNLENRFTGWHDVDLTDTGVAQAKTAGQLLKDAGFTFDQAYTSVLLRAIKTLNIALEEMGQHYLPVERHWRLNERHYGGLTGLNKQETVDLHGEDKVHEWRRSYSTRPPSMPAGHPHDPNNDLRYQSVPKDQLPNSECLADVVDRLVPYWEGALSEDLATTGTVLVAAHGNSLRALVKHLDGISDHGILDLNIPTGAPIVYELDSTLKPLESLEVSERYLR